MSVADDLTNLQQALNAVESPVGLRPIRRVYLNPTEKTVTTAELPCLLLFWRRQPRIKFHTFRVEGQEIEYVLQFVYNPVGQGTLNDNVNEAIQYQVPILDALYAHMRLYNIDNWSIPTSGGLPGTLSERWGEQEWFGFDILISVLSTRQLTIGV